MTITPVYHECIEHFGEQTSSYIQRNGSVYFSARAKSPNVDVGKIFFPVDDEKVILAPRHVHKKTWRM